MSDDPVEVALRAYEAAQVEYKGFSNVYPTGMRRALAAYLEAEIAKHGSRIRNIAFMVVALRGDAS